jgi:LCP family protein required for cell wall assembly
MVSIPRDTWVHIDGYPYGNHHAKINAAFSYGGPELAYKTVQQFTGLTIDHVAVIDWVGFRELTEALGGVRIYIPETFTDYKQDVTWEKGWHTLEGSDALKYVRTRHGLANGDFDRMARQQNFLRAIMAKMLSSSTTHNPLRFSKVLASLSSYLTIDSTWDNDELRSLAWSLRNLHAGDVDFFTAPFGSYATIDGQSVVRLDMPQFRFLMRSIDDDHVEKYVARYPGNHLASQTNIN